MAIIMNRAAGRPRRYMGGIQTALRGIPLALAVAAIGYMTVNTSHADTPLLSQEAEDGLVSGNAVPGDPNGASGNGSVLFQDGTAGITLSNTPTQPAAFIYSDTPNATATAAYAKPGALVVAGRAAYQDQSFKNVSAAGGTVLMYLDALIDSSYGRYQQMLIGASDCGAAVTRWPGSPKANDYGYLTDFRVGSVLQQKLECVLNKMVAENPHMAGWFADDLGSRSYYPGFNWDTWSAADKQAYRDGAVALVQTFRKVADEHGLLVMVNGTWNAGTVTTTGGGYPDASKHGNSLADGALVEHHDSDDPAFFKAYTCSTQWAAQSPLTKGKAFNWTVNLTDAGRTTFVNAGCYAFAGTQATYENAPAPWTTFHATGLPNRVTR